MMRFGGDDLKESILQALFTQKMSEDGQGGFWGHALTEEQLQSSLWQHYPGLATEANLQGAQNAAKEALAPFMENGQVTALDLENTANTLHITVTLKNHQMLKLP